MNWSIYGTLIDDVRAWCIKMATKMAGHHVKREGNKAAHRLVN
jgi:hypothetical protein